MVQGSSSFHIPDVHIGPILQQKLTSNQWTLWNKKQRNNSAPALKSKSQICSALSLLNHTAITRTGIWLLYQIQAQLGYITLNMNRQRIGQKQLWEHTVKIILVSHYHSLEKQTVPKEQAHRNTPIVPLPFLPHQLVLYITYPSHCLNEWCCFVFFYVDPVYFSSMGQRFCHIRKILVKGSSIQLQSWIRLFGVTEYWRLLLISFWKGKKKVAYLILAFIRYLLGFWPKVLA